MELWSANKQDTYHQRAYLETLLKTTDATVKRSQFPQGWYNHITAVSQYTAANIKNDDAQCTALSQQHKDALKAQKDALVPFGAQRTLYDSVMNIRRYNKYKEV